MNLIAPPLGAPEAAHHRGSTNGRFALALMLVGLAGWVDGIGLVQWNAVYVSFMSGNTVAFGASLAVGDWHSTGQGGSAIVVFVMGVVLGEVVGPMAGAWRTCAIVAVEAALLWLALASAQLGWGEEATLSISGLAMGVQTAALHQVDGLGVALTYVTGTLVNLGRSLAAALRRQAPWSKTAPFVALWAALPAGAIAGALTARSGLSHALAGAAGVATLLAGLAALAARRKEA